MTDPFPFTPEYALEVWYQAAESELGIIVPVADPKDVHAIVNKMYEAKKDVNDPRLVGLSIHAKESAIFVYKKEVELDD